ncbi:hypothetical protein Sjap_026055 [Stephania japonica]|uniref:Uncharacterized protein n=1 Tax=Stephania japonica TaxID=461633 RepID=A0AAP0EAP4_9MAGN
MDHRSSDEPRVPPYSIKRMGEPRRKLPLLEVLPGRPPPVKVQISQSAARERALYLVIFSEDLLEYATLRLVPGGQISSELSPSLGLLSLLTPSVTASYLSPTFTYDLTLLSRSHCHPPPRLAVVKQAAVLGKLSSPKISSELSPFLSLLSLLTPSITVSYLSPTFTHDLTLLSRSHCHPPPPLAVVEQAAVLGKLSSPKVFSLLPTLISSRTHPSPLGFLPPLPPPSLVSAEHITDLTGPELV